MAKDPAFLFYPNDWIGGTMGMTFEEKGAYVELLMLQFNRGHMTKDMIGHAVGQLWVKIEDKFRKDKDGLYYNVRLDFEKEKRKKYAKSRSNNKLGTNQYTNKCGHMTDDMTLHMENVNVNVNSTTINGFNTMPILENFNGLPDIKIGAAVEFVRITKRVELTNKQVTDIWEVFKIQNITGKKYYQNEDAVYSHFLNWIKTQNFTDGSTIKSNSTAGGRNAGANELLQKIKRNAGI